MHTNGGVGTRGEGTVCVCSHFHNCSDRPPRTPPHPSLIASRQPLKKKAARSSQPFGLLRRVLGCAAPVGDPGTKKKRGDELLTTPTPHTQTHTAPLPAHLSLHHYQPPTHPPLPCSDTGTLTYCCLHHLPWTTVCLGNTIRLRRRHTHILRGKKAFMLM